MNVALFVTCLADHYFADAAADAVRLLRHLGCEVGFPPDQTCCGQPAYNAGRDREARRMAAHTLDVFANADAVVVPSGSCATMVKEFYPRLMASTDARKGGARRASAQEADEHTDGPRRRDVRKRSGPVRGAGSGEGRGPQAAALADRTWELAEFIVHGLGVTRLGTGLSGVRVAVHQGCHALRELRLETEPATLLAGAGAEVVPWKAQDECCGFGGLFSVKMGAVSAAMADRKIFTLPDADWVVSGDGGCILQLDGRSRQLGREIEFVHLATALWKGVQDGRSDPVGRADLGAQEDDAGLPDLGGSGGRSRPDGHDQRQGSAQS